MRWLQWCVPVLVLWPRGAAADELRLLPGFTQVQLAADVWEYELEDQFLHRPQADRAGNIYMLDQSYRGGAGRRIVRVRGRRVDTFAEVAGPGQPRLAAMTFDGDDHMLVIMLRTVSTPGGHSVRRRTYHKIAGFRALSPPLRIPTGPEIWLKHTPTGPLLAGLALCMSAMLAVIARQVKRNARLLRDRLTAGPS